MLRRLFRLSLRSLLLLTCAAGSAVGLWLRWGPWVKIAEFEGMQGTQSVYHPYIEFSPSRDRVSLSVFQHDGAGKDLQRLYSKSGKLIKSIETARPHPPVFSPNGERVCMVNIKGEVEVWSAQSGEVTATFAGNQYGVMKMAYSTDGGLLAILPLYGAAEVYQAATHKHVASIPCGQPMYMSFVPDDNSRIVTHGLYEGKVLDVTDQRVITSRPDESGGDYKHFLDKFNHCRIVETGDVAPGLMALILGNLVYVIDTHTGAKAGEIDLHTTWALKALFSNDRTEVYVLDYEGWLSVWDITGHWRRSFNLNLRDHRADFRCIGDKLYFQDSDGNVCIFDPKTGAVPCKQKVAKQGVTFSPDGKLLVAGSERPEIWELRRPPEWWGIAYLTEFWMTLLFFGAFIWSRVNEFWRI